MLDAVGMSRARGQFGGAPVGPVSERRISGQVRGVCCDPLKIVLPPPTVKVKDHTIGVVNDHRILHRNVRPFLSHRHHGR